MAIPLELGGMSAPEACARAGSSHEEPPGLNCARALGSARRSWGAVGGAGLSRPRRCGACRGGWCGRGRTGRPGRRGPPPSWRRFRGCDRRPSDGGLGTGLGGGAGGAVVGDGRVAHASLWSLRTPPLLVDLCAIDGTWPLVGEAVVSSGAPAHGPLRGIAVDRTAAARLGVGPGGTVRLGGREMSLLGILEALPDAPSGPAALAPWALAAPPLALLRPLASAASAPWIAAGLCALLLLCGAMEIAPAPIALGAGVATAGTLLACAELARLLAWAERRPPASWPGAARLWLAALGRPGAPTGALLGTGDGLGAGRAGARDPGRGGPGAGAGPLCP